MRAATRPSASSHGQGRQGHSRSMDQHAPDIAVAAFGASPKFRLAPGRHLSKDETEPGCQVAATTERLGLADRSNQGSRGHGAGPRNRRQQLHRCIPAGEVRDEGLNPFVKSAPFVSHILDQQTDPAADRHFADEKLVKLAFELASSLGDHDSPFRKDCAKLVDQRGALADETIAGPMQNLHVELLVALQINEARCRTGRPIPRSPRHRDRRSRAPERKGEHIWAISSVHHCPVR